MGRHLFGTDGIRGVAGEPPLDPRTVHAVGVALGAWTREHGESPQVVIGMDTRESGPWIAAQVAGGLARHGVRARFAGLITTPGVAFLARNEDFAAGVMISASHNPFGDNGIKVFGHTGYKLPDAEEELLEESIFAALESGIEDRAVDLIPEPELDQHYIAFLKASVPAVLAGMRVAVDCGNGAATHIAPAVLAELGAEVVRSGCEPDGRNINLCCGATHLEPLTALVPASGARVGFAFDGDADRCLAVCQSGRVVDGDAILLLCARYLRSQGRLAGDIVVATVMSNLGLELALREEGISLVRTSVGDKYVLEEMRSRKAAIGGEQSGHVIFLGQATTGDGVLTALRVLEVMTATGKSLDELLGGMEVFPQRLLNVRVRERRPLHDLIAVARAIQRAEDDLNGRGRVLVRYSGTEPLARVMVEGPTNESVDLHAGNIAAAIRAELG